MHLAEQRRALPRGRSLAERWRSWLAGALLVLMVAVVYWPTAQYEFVSDDTHYVIENGSIRSLRDIIGAWRNLKTFENYQPVTFTSLYVDYQLWGLNPGGYHVVNWLLHAATAVLAWRLLIRLAVPGAWLAAAIFAVHPVCVESVAWISERKNMLSCSLALASMLAYLRFAAAERWRNDLEPAVRDWRSYALALVLYLLAILGKSTVVSMPAVLLVIDWWKRGRITWRDAVPLLPFFAFGVLIGLMSLWMEGEMNGVDREMWQFSLVDHVLIAGRALCFYVGKLTWPHPLNFVYPRWLIDAHAWWQYLYPLAVLVVLGGLWWAGPRLGRGPLAAALVYCGVLLPSLGFFYAYGLMVSFVFDHLQYQASIALFALAGAAVALLDARLAGWKRWLERAAVGCIVGALAILAHSRVGVFQNPRILNEDILAKNPDAIIAEVNLAMWYEQQGQDAESVPHRRRAVEVQDQLAGKNPDVAGYRGQLAAYWVRLGLAERRLKHWAAAEVAFRNAIGIDEKLLVERPDSRVWPNDLAWGITNLALLQQDKGRLADAADAHRRSIAIRERLAQENPGDVRLQNELAASYVDLGLVQRDLNYLLEAKEFFCKSIAIREQLLTEEPDSSTLQGDLAWSFVHLATIEERFGLPADAANSYRRAIALRQRLAMDQPHEVHVLSELAASYLDLAEVQRKRGDALEATSLSQNSVKIREQQVRDHPDDGALLANLGWSYANLGVSQLAAGQLAAALDTLERAVEIRERRLQERPSADDYQALAWSYTHLGVARLANGQTSVAERCHQKAIDIREKLTQQYPARADYQQELAQSRAELRRVQQSGTTTH